MTNPLSELFAHGSLQGGETSHQALGEGKDSEESPHTIADGGNNKTTPNKKVSKKKNKKAI